MNVHCCFVKKSFELRVSPALSIPELYSCFKLVQQISTWITPGASDLTCPKEFTSPFFPHIPTLLAQELALSFPCVQNQNSGVFLEFFFCFPYHYSPAHPSPSYIIQSDIFSFCCVHNHYLSSASCHACSRLPPGPWASHLNPPTAPFHTPIRLSRKAFNDSPAWKSSHSLSWIVSSFMIWPIVPL